MNSTVKTAFIFLAGVAAGVIGTKLVLDNSYEARYQQEIESVKAIFKKEQDHSAEMHEKRTQSLIDKIEMTEDECNTYRHILESNGYQIYTSDDVRDGKIPPLKSKYDQKLESEAPTDDEEEAATDEAIFNLASNSPKNPVPYIINYEDFNTGAPEYDKLSVEFYSYDHVLVDEVGNVLSIDETVGAPAVDKLEKGEEDVIFVRNEWLEIDYELSLRDMAFDQHLGINRD